MSLRKMDERKRPSEHRGQRRVSDLNLMRTLLILVQEGSVSRAAVKLNLTQPTLSHALGQLRRVFDDPLLVRTGGRMSPTARCLEIADEIRDLLVRFDRLTTETQTFDPTASRLRMTIMAPEFATDVLAPALIRRIQQLSSTIEVEFITTDPIEALALLEQGAIDFRLGWWPQPAPALRRKLLWTDSLCCILRKGHPLLNQSFTAETYFNAAHVRVRRPGRSYSMASIDNAAAKTGKKPYIGAWVQNAHTMASVVAATDMVGTLSRRLVKHMSHEPLQIRDLPLEVPKLKVALYWHERTHRSAAHRWLRDLLFDVARQA
jgi:DNA-binding transcriptional LysR family regulator